MSSTVVSRCVARHSRQLVTTTGRSVSRIPERASGPTTGSPRRWLQRELVWWSYMSLFDRKRRPEEPKVYVVPRTVAW